ncbi:MAG TPA: hypothetical protein VFE27_18035 [Acidobacteriaceae bacterium]|jgi:hypothetical protein|nr:hypothetical protein [Acidobacteriaceae bacterium]
MKHYALLPLPEEVRDWCSTIGAQMMHWPGVKMNHVFGTRAFYHRKVMFAMLPDKRSLHSSTAISFITPPQDEANRDANWQTFELTDRNLDAALVSLEKAYRDSMLYSSVDRPSPRKPGPRKRDAQGRITDSVVSL